VDLGHDYSTSKMKLDGFDDVIATLKARGDRIGYVVLNERQPGGPEENIGRWDMTPEETERYLDPLRRDSMTVDDSDDELSKAFGDDSDDDDSDDDDSDDDGSDDDGAEDEDDDSPRMRPRGLRRPARTFTLDQTLQAACRWIATQAMRLTHGESSRKFRIRIYSTKGRKQIGSAHFTCHNTGYKPTDPKVTVAQEQERLGKVQIDAEARGVAALADYYRAYGQLVLDTMQSFAKATSGTISQVTEQNKELRDQVDDLVTAIIKLRHHYTQTDLQRQLSSQQVGVKQMLAKEGMMQVGETLRLLVGGANVNPELLPLVTIVGQNPELIAALKDPVVQNALKDPAKVRDLMMLVKHLEGQAAHQLPGGVGPGQAPATQATAPQPAPSETPPESPGA